MFPIKFPLLPNFFLLVPLGRTPCCKFPSHTISVLKSRKQCNKVKVCNKVEKCAIKCYFIAHFLAKNCVVMTNRKSY
jgi:hypothetical protein